MRRRPAWYTVSLALFAFMCFGKCRADQYLEIKADIEVNEWDFWLLRDRRQPRTDDIPNLFTKSIFPKSHSVRCVVGTSTWLMQGEFSRNANVTQWFTGTNIIERTVITSAVPDAEAKQLAAAIPLGFSRPPVGSSYINTYESSDGNPGRPVRVADLLELNGRIAWLAFCSGSVLKQSGKRLFPPSDLWKETRLGFSYPFSDKVVVFDDGLGLPKRLTLYATNGLPVLEYQVNQSTNVFGWNIPLEFYVIQYVAHGTNDWLLELTAKGKVTSIGLGSRPSIAMEVK